MQIYLLGLFTWFLSDADNRFQTRSREQISAVKRTQRFRVQLRAHRSYFLSTSCLSKDKKVVQSASQSVSQQRSDPWSDQRISKWSIASLDIFITLILYKPARLLSGAKFCSHDQIHFQTQPRYMGWKNALFRRPFEHWSWEYVWNPVSDAKTRSREGLNCQASWPMFSLFMYSLQSTKP